MIQFAIKQDFIIYSIVVFAVGVALGAYLTVLIVAKTNTNRLHLNQH